MAQKNNISIYKGEATQLAFTMTPTTDITGWTLTFSLKPNASDPTASLTIAGAITNAAAGTFTITISHAQTGGLASGTYAYDVQRTNSGSETVLSIGVITVNQEVLF